MDETRFEHSRFGIRRYRIDDVASLYEALRVSLSEISTWMPWCHAGYSMEDSAVWVFSRDLVWRENQEYDFVIYDRQDEAFVGAVGLNQINRLNQMANLGYWVSSQYTGRGAATEGTQLAARFGFEVLGLQRIEILVAHGNQASQRVAMKAGASREGILRNRLQLHGKAHDAVLFSLLKEDLGLLHSGGTLGID